MRALRDIARFLGMGFFILACGNEVRRMFMVNEILGGSGTNYVVGACFASLIVLYWAYQVVWRVRD